MTCIKNHVNGYSHICLILIKCTDFDPYLMDMHMRTEGENWFSPRQNLRLLLTLFGSKPHSIIIFHLKTYMQNLEITKMDLNPYNCCKNKINLIIYGHVFQNENIQTGLL